MYGIYPFWFWNDHLDPSEIRRQVAEMADQGVSGFFIHPRQGLGQPYLSDAFFECVTAAVEAAEEHGLVVHLYDEYPYPSGIAGGEVVSGRPEYRATALVSRHWDVRGGETRLELPKGLVLGLSAVALVDGVPDWTTETDLRSAAGQVLVHESYNEIGLTSYNRKRYFASGPLPVLACTLPDRPHRVFASVQQERTGHKYWDHFVDVLNPDAIRLFISLTHERYAERFGDRFGKSIASIFVDETRPGWSARIPDAFRERYGYDLLDNLVALQAREHPDHRRIRFDLYNLQYDLFCEAFEAPIAGWCRAHDLAYSGEKHALRFDQLRYMDIPGCDPGHTKIGAPSDMYEGDARRNARATASGAYFYGKQAALCECYHSVGWSATLQDAKLIGEELLLNGITCLVPHGFFYSTHSLKKHDAPPTFFFQMPYWPFFGRLADRFRRITDAFAGTRVDARVLLIEPESGMPSKDDHAVYTETQRSLLAHHIEFLMADVEVLRSGEIESGVLSVKDLTVDTILVTPTGVMRQSLVHWLREAEAAGLRVVRIADQDDIEAAISGIVAPSPVELRAPGSAAGAVRVVKRTATNGESLWFLINTSADPVDLTLATSESLVEVPLDDSLPATLSPIEGGCRRPLAPFASCLLRTGTTPPPPLPPAITVHVPSDCTVETHDANLLRMDPWTLSVSQGDRPASESAVVTAQPVMNQLVASGLTYAPDVKLTFGHRPELRMPQLDLSYAFNFASEYDGPVTLVMEPGSIRGDWSIDLNGTVVREPDFAATDAHVRGSLGCDVTDAVRTGDNRLVLHVRTDRMDGGLLNALYLAGDFGVHLDPPTLASRAKSGRFEAYRENGLPYYAGTLTYGSTFDIADLPDAEHVSLDFAYEVPFHEATEVSVNGGPFIPVLWQPRSIVLPRVSLNVGSNTLVTRVHTSLIRSFEGEWFDYEQHAGRPVSEGP